MKQTKGFTLIEILVATGIVLVVLVAITSGVSFAVSNSRFSQEKSLSITYAQESLEAIRARRNSMGWRGFYDTLKDDNPSSIRYCFHSIPETDLAFQQLIPSELSECPVIPETTFKRSVEIEIFSSPQRVEVTSIVEWNNGSKVYDTTLNTTLYDWD